MAIRAALHPGSDSAPPDAGFSLVEIMVAMMIFAIIAMAAVSSLGSMLHVATSSRHRTVAEEIATSCMEQLRATSYDSLGTTSGNPAGTVAPSSSQVSSGATYTINRTISYVDDALPGGYKSYANYKLATCKVTQGSTVLATMRTKIAAATTPSRSKGIIKVTVLDQWNAPIVGASVQLANGPDPTRSETTPADGTVPFAALTPTPATGTTAYYDITTTVAGYTTLADDVPPLAVAHKHLAAGETAVAFIHMYKPPTIRVHLRTPLGAVFAPAASIYISSSRGSSTFANVVNGELTATTVDGELIVPNLTYTVSASSPGVFGTSVPLLVGANATDLVKDFTITMTPNVNTATLTVTVQTGPPAIKIAGAPVLVTGGPSNVFLVGITNAVGVVTFTVPKGTATQLYTYTVPPYLTYGQALGTTAVTANVSKTITVS